MKKLLVFILLMGSFSSFSQVVKRSGDFIDNHSYVLSQIEKLDKALLNKKLYELEKVLHPNLSFGHSNVWTETKESLIENLPTSHVFYEKFIYKDKPEIQFSGNVAVVRRKITAIGKYKKKSFDVDLNVLEIWIKENKEWYLLARQSVEVEFEE